MVQGVVVDLVPDLEALLPVCWRSGPSAAQFRCECGFCSVFAGALDVDRALCVCVLDVCWCGGRPDKTRTKTQKYGVVVFDVVF